MNANVDLLSIAAIGIEAAAPGGSVRDTAAFVAMAAEIAKLDSIHAAEVSWTSVRDLALQVLAQSHDFLAAAYLAHALQRTHGYPGLSAGLAAMRNLMTAGWNAAQPPPDRLKARRSAVQWLADRSARYAASTASDPVAEAACERSARALAEACRERFDGADAGFAALARLLAPTAAVGLSAEPDATRADAVPGVADAVRAVASTTASSRAQAIQRLTDAAIYFQCCEPHSPIGPLLQRALGWSGKGFADVFSELLGSAPEAKAGIWKTLGIAGGNERA